MQTEEKQIRKKNVSRALLDAFVIIPMKESGGFFRDIFITFKTMFIFLISPVRVLKKESLLVEDFRLSRTLFKFIFFALLIKIALDEVTGASSLTVIEQALNQFMFLVAYIVALFFSLFTAFVWSKINVLKEQHVLGSKMFIHILNFIILFSLILFMFQIELNAGVHYGIVFFIPLIVLLRVKKFFNNKFTLNFISSFIAAFLLSIYFFLMSVMLEAIWNMNIINTKS